MKTSQSEICIFYMRFVCEPPASHHHKLVFYFSSSRFTQFIDKVYDLQIHSSSQSTRLLNLQAGRTQVLRNPAVIKLD